MVLANSVQITNMVISHLLVLHGISAKRIFQTLIYQFNEGQVGWGKTGNQEFPAGSSQTLYKFPKRRRIWSN
jgi:hypothetical protein